MLSRLRAYFSERYPLFQGLLVGYILCFEVYFLVLLLGGRASFQVGLGEASVGFTLFAFLLNLRIADDFKDDATDKKLFPDRPLASGRTRKSDLVWVLLILDAAVIALNVAFVGNHLFFAALVAYGVLMSFWFFQRHRIQHNLVLALVTHNPVQLVMNLYVITFACARAELPVATWDNLLVLFSLYFPGLVWELGRKVRAPQDETDYVTYSKLFGVRTPVRVIVWVLLVEAVMRAILIYQLYPWAVALVVGAYAWLLWQCQVFLRDPKRFTLVTRLVGYVVVVEGLMIVFIVGRLLGWGVA